MTLVALACLVDPIRPDVPEAIAACNTAGVRVIMLTGDHPETAAEVARQAGLGDGEISVIEGRELGDFDSAALTEQQMQRILHSPGIEGLLLAALLSLAPLRFGQIILSSPWFGHRLQDLQPE